MIKRLFTHLTQGDKSLSFPESFSNHGGTESFSNHGGSESFSNHGGTESFSNHGGTESFSNHGGTESRLCTPSTGCTFILTVTYSLA